MNRCLLIILITGILFRGQTLAADGIVIHQSEPLKKIMAQGSADYGAVKDEKPFEEKITEKNIDDLWSHIKVPRATNMTDAEWQKMQEEQAKANRDMVSVETYELPKQAGQFVGWFGIVRSLKYDEATNKTNLLIEHKYFDGSCDLDMLVVSIFGAGDFNVVIPGKVDAKQIKLLSLVRVYGTVLIKKNETTPMATIDGKYVRAWDWGLFTFMDYGKDKSNPDWVKFRKIKREHTYSRQLNNEYYQERIGPRANEK